MAAISGIGKIRDGALIRYAGVGGDGEGVVMDQSDPNGWFDDGNVALLDITVQPLSGEDEVELSGTRVREVLAEPDEHDHTPRRGGDIPRQMVPDGPEDVRQFVDHHGPVTFTIQYTAMGEDRSATGPVTATTDTLIHITDSEGEDLGLPYSVLTGIAVSRDEPDD